jgi:hypothetical protein
MLENKSIGAFDTVRTLSQFQLKRSSEHRTETCVSQVPNPAKCFHDKGPARGIAAFDRALIVTELSELAKFGDSNAVDTK